MRVKANLTVGSRKRAAAADGHRKPNSFQLCVRRQQRGDHAFIFRLAQCAGGIDEPPARLEQRSKVNQRLVQHALR